jgi:hypothetical protein
LKNDNLTRIAPIALLSILLAGIMLGSAAPRVSAQSLTLPWTQTTSYPLDIASQTCVTDGGYVYCIGGYTGDGSTNTDVVYYASLSSGGVGAWTQTTSYPVDQEGMACVTDSAYIFCMTNANPAFPVYYAPLSSGGVGAWISGTIYPPSAVGPGCVVDFGYVYCIGGEGNGAINNVYFASITPSSGPSPVPEFNLPAVLVASISMAALAVLVRVRSARLRPQSVS